MQNLKLKVIYQDPHILVIEKEAGLITAQTDTGTEKNTIEDILKNEYLIDIEQAGLVHRLDKDTSGVLVVARTNQALTNLQSQFKERKVKKVYVALVHGIIEQKGEVNVAIGRNPIRHDKFSIVEEGRESSTEYEPVEKFKIQNEKIKSLVPGMTDREIKKLEHARYGEFTLLKCYPKTGRTHQIRVHLKYINHPIVGDLKYGGRKISRVDKIWVPRQFLHAQKLSFYHPQTNKWMEFESKLPQDLEEVLAKLI